MAIKVSDYFKAVYASVPTVAQSLGQAIPEVVDANGDGIDDILLFGAYYPFSGSNPVAQPAQLMIGKGDGTYTANNALLPASLSTTHPREAVQGDFNGDGKMDLFIADHGYDAAPFNGAQNKLLLFDIEGGDVVHDGGAAEIAERQIAHLVRVVAATAIPEYERAVFVVVDIAVVA